MELGKKILNQLKWERIISGLGALLIIVGIICIAYGIFTQVHILDNETNTYWDGPMIFGYWPEYLIVSAVILIVGLLCWSGEFAQSIMNRKQKHKIELMEKEKELEKRD